MAYDGLVLAAVKRELEKDLVGGRIDKIHQPEKEEIILSVRQPGESFRLLLSANAQNPRIHLTNQSKTNPQTPPLFCMVLRKHLEGGRIRRFVQPGLERVLCLYVEALDELGNPGEKLLVCEIMGKHSNIILVDPATNTIIDSIKRVPHFISRHREVLPGKPYLPPPGQEKLDPLQIGEDRFRNLIYSSPLESRLEKVLLNNFTGLSPQTCRELVFRAGLPEKSTVETCGLYELRRLWEAFGVIQAMGRSQSFAPTLVRDLQGKAVAFSALDLTQMFGLSREQGSMNQVLDTFYRERYTEELLSRQKQSLGRLINSELERNERKLQLQREALREGEEAETCKIWGELLTANLFRLEKGLEEVRLANFHDPHGTEVAIPLDPQLTPVENAQRYFRKYARARDSKKVILEQQSQTLAEISYLESVAASLETTGSLEEVAEIREELLQQGYLKEKAPAKAGPQRTKTESKPLSFISSDGLEILVGKNNRQNDLLTMKLARPEDLWLHAKDIPGSHVIIRRPPDGNIPAATLEEGAGLAAYYSKARESGKVPVDYTLRKHVHKPKGAKPGMVIYENQRTVYVTPRSMP